MMRMLIAVVAGMFVGGFAMSGEAWEELPKKEIFEKREYPRFLAFRGEMQRAAHGSYEEWKDFFKGTSGLIRKFATEELPVKPESVEWVKRFAEEAPGKLLLLHLNGESRLVKGYPDVMKRYFLGHWVYEAGSLLAEDCGEADERVKVKEIRFFKEKAYRVHNSAPVRWEPGYVLLVELGEKGERLWDRAEVVRVKAVEKAAGELVVERGVLGTKARGVAGQRTYAAPVAGVVWAKDVMLFYNFASTCPRDAKGRQAADVFAEEIAGWFAKDGMLRNLNGVAFDVNYFDASKHPTWDVNNDGAADGGWVEGRNVWREGDWGFFKKLRGLLGEGRIISCDAQHDENQQAVGVLDGMESEGLVQHNDGWRGISRTINTHLYWKGNNPRALDFRYVVLKLMDKNDEKSGERLRRFAVGTAVCLEAFTTQPANRDFLPEWMREEGALGKVKGELRRVAKESPVVWEKGAVKVPSAKKGERNLKVSLGEVELPAGDVTIFVEARAVEPLEGFKAEDAVPRWMKMSFSPLPDYGEGRKAGGFYEEIYGLFGTKRVEEMSFYFRNTAAGKKKIELEMQGRGKVEIKSVKVYNATDVLVRRFEKGVVCVNPSLRAVEVPVDGARVEVPAVDAVFLQGQ